MEVHLAKYSLIPVNLNSSQKELLKEFDKLLEKDSKKHAPYTKKWFDNVKDFFSKK